MINVNREEVIAHLISELDILSDKANQMVDEHVKKLDASVLADFVIFKEAQKLDLRTLPNSYYSDVTDLDDDDDDEDDWDEDADTEEFEYDLDEDEEDEE